MTRPILEDSNVREALDKMKQAHATMLRGNCGVNEGLTRLRHLRSAEDDFISTVAQQAVAAEREKYVGIVYRAYCEGNKEGYRGQDDPDKGWKRSDARKSLATTEEG